MNRRAPSPSPSSQSSSFSSSSQHSNYPFFNVYPSEQQHQQQHQQLNHHHQKSLNNIIPSNRLKNPNTPTKSTSTSTSNPTTPTGIAAAVGGAIVGAVMRGAATSGLRFSNNTNQQQQQQQQQKNKNSIRPLPRKSIDSNSNNPNQSSSSTSSSSKPNSSAHYPQSPSERRKKDAKVDQVIQHFYTKTAQLIIDSRMENLNNNSSSSSNQPSSRHRKISTTNSNPKGKETSTAGSQTRRDKWFNLELDDPEYFKDELKIWKSVSSILFGSQPSLTSSNPSPSTSQGPQPNFELMPIMVFETILDLQELGPDSFLVLVDSHGREIRVDHRISGQDPQSLNEQQSSSINKNIVLEKWTVSLSGPVPRSTGPELPTVYRHCIVHFRALYTLLRTMPGWRLFKRLRQLGNGTEDGLLKIGCRLSTTNSLEEFSNRNNIGNQTYQTFSRAEIQINEKLSGQDLSTRSSSSFTFPRVYTPIGTLNTEVIYRNEVEFTIRDRESVMSNRFLEEDRKQKSQRPISLISRGLYRSRTDPPSSVPNQTSEPMVIHTTDPSINHPTSYGSLSSRHQLQRKNPSLANADTEANRPGSNSLTAALQAATESSPFPTTANVPNNGNGNGNSSALTAKLVSHRQSLPPVLSNALPLPSSSMSRSPSSGTTSKIAGNSIGIPSMSGASPRQISLMSTSPISGPSSSIRISTTGQQNLLYQTNNNKGSSSSTSPPTQIGPRPMNNNPGSPMVRRYSSSRHSRSFGANSSGGTGGIGGVGGTMIESSTGGSSSLSRKALMNSTTSSNEQILRTSGGPSVGKQVSGNSNAKMGEGEGPRKSITDEEKLEINRFLALIDSKPDLRKLKIEDDNDDETIESDEDEAGRFGRKGGKIKGKGFQNVYESKKVRKKDFDDDCDAKGGVGEGSKEGEEKDEFEMNLKKINQNMKKLIGSMMIDIETNERSNPRRDQNFQSGLNNTKNFKSSINGNFNRGGGGGGGVEMNYDNRTIVIDKFSSDERNLAGNSNGKDLFVGGLGGGDNRVLIGRQRMGSCSGFNNRINLTGLREEEDEDEDDELEDEEQDDDDDEVLLGVGGIGIEL